MPHFPNRCCFNSAVWIGLACSLLVPAGSAPARQTDTRIRTSNQNTIRRFNAAYAFYTLWTRTGGPGLLDQALKELDTARKSDSKNAFLVEWMGFLQLKQERYEEALKSLQEATRMDPNAPEVYVNEGYAYSALKRYREAAEAFEKAIPVFKRRARPDPKTNTLRADLRRVYFNLGAVYSQEKRYSDAELAFRHAADMQNEKPTELDVSELALYNPMDRAETDRSRVNQSKQGINEAQIQDGLGGALFKQERYEEAAACYDRAARLDSNNSRYWKHLAEAYQALAAREKPGTPAFTSAWEKAAQAQDRAVMLDPEDYRTRESYGSTLVALGRNDDARSQFQKAEQARRAADPSDRPTFATLLHYGLADARTGHDAEALVHLMEAANADPNNVTIWEWIGYVQVKRQKYAEALPALEKAFQLGAQHQEMRLNLGRTYYALQRYDDAIQQFEALTKLMPDSVIMLYTLGDLYLKQNRYPEASRTYRHVVELDAESRIVKDGAAYGNLGFVQERLGNLAEATGNYEKAANFAPNNTQFRLNLAFARYALSKTDPGAQEAARAALVRAVELAPDDYRVREALAVTLTSLKRYDESIPQWERAAQLDPMPFNALVNLGRIQDRRNHLPEAIDAYQRALKIQPGNSDILAMLGQAQMRQKRPAEAALTFAELSKQRPGDINAALIRYDLLKQNGDTPGAIAVLAEAIPKASRSVERARARRSLAFEYLSRKGQDRDLKENIARAEEQYRLSLEDAPDDPKRVEALTGLGNIALRRKQYPKAIDYLKQAIALDPQYADAYNNLGAAYEYTAKNNDDVVRAIAQYKKAAALDPNNKIVKSNLARWEKVIQYLNQKDKQKLNNASRL